MLIQYLQHVSFESLGSIEDWARVNNHQTRAARLFDDEPFPSLDAFDWLIVLGGPMNVYEEDAFPFLKREKQFIEETIRAGKTVLGICLGSQLIADVLGAKVFKNEHEEIGWFQVELTNEAREESSFSSLPQKFMTFHWHGDTFVLPAGAKRLAFSEACKYQAFGYGDNVLAVQFHPEVDETCARLMLENEGGELSASSYVQTEEAILARRNLFRENALLMHRLLDNLVQRERKEES